MAAAGAVPARRDDGNARGAGVLRALARVLEELVPQLQGAKGPVARYTDVVLRCLVSLFLVEEGWLAARVRRCSYRCIKGAPSCC